jgi:hypothetical protein
MHLSKKILSFRRTIREREDKVKDSDIIMNVSQLLY